MLLWISRSLLLALLTPCVLSQTRMQEDDAKSYWNKVYAGGGRIFVRQPTTLVNAVKERRPGKALDIGMGQGRNAIFLAQQGWDVTGFDPSDEGVRQAQAKAGKVGVRLHALVARQEDFDLGASQWDLIVMTYVRRLKAGDDERLASALRPGGIFVYENNNVGEQNELLRTFLQFRILRFEDIDTNSDWHPEIRQRVERLVVEKPVGH
jgi:2-polyprenyl-3-methyl-5-hydroxy-6-metoxy-1,4-benzoquinol methylase